jgi:predicted  nucleic acid-binding Zn-ribbon protein
LEIPNESLPTEPPTPPTKTSEALRANLQSVNSHLAAMQKEWKKEKRQLLGEKAVLEDAANRLNAQVRDAKEEVKRIAETGRAGEKMRAGSQGVSSHSL